MGEMRTITYKDAVREAMCEEMRRDEKVFLMGEDIGRYCGAFGVSKGMLDEFGPERIIETPISETAFMGAGVGAAITGMRPIVELMFSDFMAVCYDQIINQAAKMHFMFAGKVNVPMVIRTPSGGGTGAAAQHSQSLEQMYLHVPGLKVVVPSTPYDAKGLLKTAIRDNNPVVFLEQKRLYNTKGQVPAEDYTIPFGVADTKKEGKDVSIITYGRMVQMSLQVAEKLENEGISAELLWYTSLFSLVASAAKLSAPSLTAMLSSIWMLPLRELAVCTALYLSTLFWRQRHSLLLPRSKLLFASCYKEETLWQPKSVCRKMAWT